MPGGGEEGHDPAEVTVQLDSPHGVPGARGDGQEASDAPVFVDESGRRSRTFRRIGIAVALACGAYAVVIVATLLSGSAGAPWLPVPGQNDDKPAEQVDTTRPPSSPATPTQPGFAAPVHPGVTASGSASEAPGAGGAPRASGSAVPPSASAAVPRPSPSASVRRPSPAPTGESPAPASSSPAASPPPDASPSPSTQPSPDSSPSPAGGADGPVA
ncbi:hypothetical protein [Streptomyces aurantiogriseus]|uniref:hypothetical protein n=1 Tax=Streptomyces aurantiogriseus TaxID=66870 RepID=UPI001675844A|nr:hypothetical protein [Streptomyces aurantiogriseus]